MHIAKSRTILFALLVVGTGGHSGWPRQSALRAAEKSQPDAAQAARTLAAWWSDLASADEGRALRAVLGMVAAPETVAFLKTRLQPVTVDLQEMARRIADLDHDQFEKRQQAALELDNLGESALPYLQKVLDGRPSLEVRRRAEQLVERIEKKFKPADWPRTMRALAILEYHAAPEARDLLEALAKGQANALLTLEAQSALDRLAQRRSPPQGALFEQFAAGDDGLAARALLALMKSPKDSVEEFVEELALRLTAPDHPRRIARLLADLDGDNPEVRRLAAAAIAQIGPAAVPALRKATTDGTLKEQTRGIIELMLVLKDIESKQADMRTRWKGLERDLFEGVVPAAPEPKPASDFEVLAKRATVLLEHLDIPQSRELSKKLAKLQTPAGERQP